MKVTIAGNVKDIKEGTTLAQLVVDGDPAADERGRTTDRCCGTGSGTGTNEVTDSENSGR